MSPTETEKSPSILVAEFLALLRMSAEGQDVGEEMTARIPELHRMQCESLEDAAALFALARAFYGKAAAYGMHADKEPDDAAKVLPMMQEGDKLFQAAIQFLEGRGGFLSALASRKDARFN
jgi:hypothetical protein